MRLKLFGFGSASGSAGGGASALPVTWSQVCQSSSASCASMALERTPLLSPILSGADLLALRSLLARSFCLCACAAANWERLLRPSSFLRVEN
eukprot:m.541567 g.541567  ORF g.541567 m.541567 type:complete len:93 (-) comp57651_c0_seq2:244-522(-)